MFRIIKLAKVVDTLVAHGRPVSKALCDVITSYGLSKPEAIQLIRLVR